MRNSGGRGHGHWLKKKNTYSPQVILVGSQDWVPMLWIATEPTKMNSFTEGDYVAQPLNLGYIAESPESSKNY